MSLLVYLFSFVVGIVVSSTLYFLSSPSYSLETYDFSGWLRKNYPALMRGDYSVMKELDFGGNKVIVESSLVLKNPGRVSP